LLEGKVPDAKNDSTKFTEKATSLELRASLTTGKTEAGLTGSIKKAARAEVGALTAVKNWLPLVDSFQIWLITPGEDAYIFRHLASSGHC
jgi:hypothetical protein